MSENKPIVPEGFFEEFVKNGMKEEDRRFQLSQSLLVSKVMEHHLSHAWGVLIPEFPLEKWEAEFQAVARDFVERAKAEGLNPSFEIRDPIQSGYYRLVIHFDGERYSYTLENLVRAVQPDPPEDEEEDLEID